MHDCDSVLPLCLGMGIHNEPGFTHLKPYPPLPKLVGQMLGSIITTFEQDPERGFLENLKHDGEDEGELTLKLQDVLILHPGNSHSCSIGQQSWFYQPT